MKTRSQSASAESDDNTPTTFHAAPPELGLSEEKSTSPSRPLPRPPYGMGSSTFPTIRKALDFHARELASSLSEEQMRPFTPILNILSDVVRELELVKLSCALNESRVSNLSLGPSASSAAPTASATASSDRPTKEVADISAIDKLSALSSKNFIKWQTSLDRHSRLIKKDPLPLDTVLVTLSGKARTLVDAKMATDLAFGNPTWDSRDLIDYLKKAAHSEAQDELLARYRNLSPSRGDSFLDLGAKYTNALLAIHNAYPRSLPLPREHVKSIFDSLPSVCQEAHRASLSSTLADYRTTYETEDNKQILKLVLEAQAKFLSLATSISQLIPFPPKSKNGRGQTNVESTGNSRRANRKRKGGDNKNNELCSKCPSTSPKHLVRLCRWTVGSSFPGKQCVYCKGKDHIAPQCTKKAADLAKSPPSAKHTSKSDSKSSSVSLPGSNSPTFSDAQVDSLLARLEERIGKNNNTSIPPSTSSTVDVDLSDCITNNTFLSSNVLRLHTPEIKTSSASKLHTEGAPTGLEENDCLTRTDSKWSTVFTFGIGRHSNQISDCLLDTGGLVKGWSYASLGLLESLRPEDYEEVQLPSVQLRGVGVDNKALTFSKAILVNIFIDGVLAKDPSKKRVLKRKVFLRLTSREHINHNLVLNEGDCAENFGLTLQLPTKSAWWSESRSHRSSMKVVPNFYAQLAASAAEKSL